MHGGGVLCGFYMQVSLRFANRGQGRRWRWMNWQKVAITFDDGPNPDYTEELLSELKERGVSATFFCWEKKWSSIRRL